MAQLGQPRDRVHIESTTGSLIGERGVDVPVADNHSTPRQPRADHGRDVLGPVGGVQQRFTARAERHLRVQQHRPQPTADIRGAGLTGADHLETAGREPRRDRLDLG